MARPYLATGPMTDSTSTRDARLCALALAGDREAWDELVGLHNRRVVLTLIAAGTRADRAKDLAQEAWVRLMQQQRQGKLKALRMPGLVLAQARFLAQMEARSEKLWVEDPELFMVAAPGASAEERLLSAEQISRAQKVLETCSPSARAIFREVYDNPEIAHATVAERVGLSVQRVRQILCEVRALLRGTLRGERDE